MMTSTGGSSSHQELTSELAALDRQLRDLSEQWETVGDEVSLKIGIKAVRAWMEEHDGELPPGISLNKYSRLNINRS